MRCTWPRGVPELRDSCGERFPHGCDERHGLACEAERLVKRHREDGEDGERVAALSNLEAEGTVKEERSGGAGGRKRGNNRVRKARVTARGDLKATKSCQPRCVREIMQSVICCGSSRMCSVTCVCGRGL